MQVLKEATSADSAEATAAPGLTTAPISSTEVDTALSADQTSEGVVTPLYAVPLSNNGAGGFALANSTADISIAKPKFVADGGEVPQYLSLTLFTSTSMGGVAPPKVEFKVLDCNGTELKGVAGVMTGMADAKLLEDLALDDEEDLFDDDANADADADAETAAETDVETVTASRKLLGYSYRGYRSYRSYRSSYRSFGYRNRQLSQTYRSRSGYSVGLSSTTLSRRYGMHTYRTSSYGYYCRSCRGVGRRNVIYRGRHYRNYANDRCDSRGYCLELADQALDRDDFMTLVIDTTGLCWPLTLRLTGASFPVAVAPRAADIQVTAAQPEMFVALSTVEGGAAAIGASFFFAAALVAASLLA